MKIEGKIMSKKNYLSYVIYGHHTVIYLTINEFINFNPPCKDCLVQSICFSCIKSQLDAEWIRIRHCDLLVKFFIDFERNKNDI